MTKYLRYRLDTREKRAGLVSLDKIMRTVVVDGKKQRVIVVSDLKKLGLVWAKYYESELRDGSIGDHYIRGNQRGKFDTLMKLFSFVPKEIKEE